MPTYTDQETCARDACLPKCLICAKTTLAPMLDVLAHRSMLSFRLLECPSCKLVKLERALDEESLKTYESDFYHLTAAQMNEKGDKKGLALFGLRSAMFRDFGVGKLLDVGCGRGYFLKVMRDRGWEVRGVEQFEPLARHARHEFQLAVESDVSALSSNHDAFNLITLWHVLEHFTDPAKMLTSFHSLLAPGGVLYAEVPNIDSIGAFLAGAYWLPYHEPTHRWFFRPQTIERLALQAGFASVKVRAVTSPDGWYGIKRGVQSLVSGQEYFFQRVRALADAPLPRRAIGKVLTTWPLPQIVARIGHAIGKGEVLQAWCS